jgi:effector-binding domain-containing protein
MLDTPQVVNTESQATALIHLKIPRSEIRSVMGPGLRELKDEVEAQGIAITGPWFTHHLRLNPATFDFELSVPVAKPVKPAGRMQPGEWPAMKMARTVYQGPFEGLGAAWKEFDGWIRSQGLAPAEDLWERYVTGPETSSDPADWRTELSRRLTGDE